MRKFNEWLQERDPQLSENWLKKQAGRLAAVGLPMATSMAGGAAGLLAGGPVAGVAGYLAGKKLGQKGSEVLFPQGALDAMKKK